MSVKLARPVLPPVDVGVVLDGIGDTVLPDGTPIPCGSRTVTPDQLTAAVDIIFIIDNSSSMEGEIAAVQQRINEDFATIIEASGTDCRVIMIARYGDVTQAVGQSDHPVCVTAPLGSSDCTSPETTPLIHNPPRFFHYSADVRSREMFCDVLEGFGTSDELKAAADANDRPWTPIAPNGWGEFLRPEAQKQFVVVTDDNSE